ncbi:hypothetical protein LMG7974_01057 [Campylobacter majalis]|uniref:DUF748 domain-containing protein n=1 Tax=Campylobacter majalis TaxID=2790656 RepID=A0ABM8Q710_9BACT|nr:DUF748 domain-containing protein [Campylobacter majalis]CAD7288577.1 hypothetical protein LMG7974_01057 [Campylobacter majalis]
MRKFYAKYKKLCICFIAFIGFLLFYTLFGFFGVPWILKDIVPKFIADKNATLTIQTAKFNPYKFELNATGINLKTTSDLVSLDAVDAKMNFSKIFAKNINIDIFRLTKPFINIERNSDLGFNFDNFISNDDNNETSSGDSFFNFTLNVFELINGGIRYKDDSLKRPFEAKFNGLNYTIKDINIKNHSIGLHRFATDSNLFESFNWDGGVDLDPLTIYGDIDFNGLNLVKIWQSYMSGSDLNVTNGFVDTKLSYNLSLDDNGIKAKLKDAGIKFHKINLKDQSGLLDLNELSLNNVDINATFANEQNINVKLGGIFVNELVFNEILIKSAEIFDILADVNVNNDLNIKGQVDKLKIDNAATKDINLNTFLVQNIDFNHDLNATNANIANINLDDLSLLTGDFSVKNEKFYINDTDINVTNGFKNFNIDVDKFGLIGFGGNGFNMQITNSGMDFIKLKTELKLDLNNTEISSNLSKIDIGSIDISSNKDKILFLTGASIDEIDFLNNILHIKDINLNKLVYNDEIGGSGLKSINSIVVPKTQKQSNKTTNKQVQNDSDFIVSVENFKILDAKSKIKQTFLNEALNHEINIKNAEILDFSSDFKKPFLLNLKANTGEKIDINLNGKVSLKPLNIDTNTKIILSDLSKLNKIVNQYINGDISGKSEIDAKFKMAKTYNLDAKFNLSNFLLTDKAKDRLASANSLKINSIKLNEKGLSLDKTDLNDAFIKAHLYKDKSLNLANMLKKSQKNDDENLNNKQEDKKSSNNNFVVSISNVALNNMGVDFSDDSLVLPFLFKIRNLNTKIDKIEPNIQTSIISSGVVGSSGSANIDARVDVFDFKKSSEFKLTFKDVELNEVTPYSATFVGRKIDAGTLDLSLDYKINDSKMDGKNELKIDTIVLGDSVEAPDAMSLPLSLAISILKDSNNIIKLNLPVRGDMDNPEFSYGGIIFSAIMQIFTDVVTSPFRLLSSVLGIEGADELADIDFTAGSDEMMHSQATKIQKLKKITDDKKDIELTITPAYDDVVDRLAVQKRLFDRDVAIMASRSSKSHDEIIRQMAAKMFKKPPKDVYNELVKGRQISQSTLENLAKNRAKNLKNAMLKAGISSDQIKLNDKIQKVKAQMDTYVGVPMGIINK